MSELDVAVPKLEDLQSTSLNLLRSSEFREKIEGIRKNVPNLSEMTIAYLLINEIFRDAEIDLETSEGQRLLNALMSPALLNEIRNSFFTSIRTTLVSEVRAAIDTKAPGILNESSQSSKLSSSVVDQVRYDQLNGHQRSCVDCVLGLQTTLQDLHFWDESIKPIVPPAARAKNVPGISLPALDRRVKDFFIHAQAVYTDREKAATDAITDPKIRSQLEVLFAFAKSGREIIRKHRDNTGAVMGVEKTERVKGTFSEVWSWLMSKRRGVPFPSRSSDLSNPLYLK